MKRTGLISYGLLQSEIEMTIHNVIRALLGIATYRVHEHKGTLLNTLFHCINHTSCDLSDVSTDALRV